jgi:hypothetical protein
MRAQTKAPAHASVSWEYRNNNVHFWTDPEKQQLGIRPRAKGAKDRENEHQETVDVGHVESQMMNINEAIMTHDIKNKMSWQMVSDVWEWISEVSERNQRENNDEAIQDPGPSPVLMTCSPHHLEMSKVGANWKDVLPVNKVTTPTTAVPSGLCFAGLPEVSYTKLRQDQQKVFNHVASPKQTLTFVLGPGGVGKTVMINALHRNFGELGQLNFAYTGVAAALLPNGRTLTGLFGKLYNSTLSDLKSLTDGVEHIVIDEISMCPMQMLINMDARLRRVRKNNLPFGGISITLVGDMVQLPVIAKAGKNIFDEHAWPPGFGTLLELFDYFTDKDFEGNQRSDGCGKLEALTSTMRKLPNFMPGGEILGPGVKTWSEQEISEFKPMDDTAVNALMTELTDADLADGFSDFPCHMFCRTNRAKSAYNLKMMERMSKARGVPVYIFKRPITHHSQLEACKDILYKWDRFPELYTVFMKGAPGVMLCNENVSLGLVNGATGTMHGIRWNEMADNVKWKTKMLDAIPGQVFEVDTPDQIFFQLDPHKDPEFWEERLQRFPKERNICPPEKRAGKLVNPIVKKHIIVALGYCRTQPAWANVKFGSEVFNFKPHNVEPSLAVTPWKSQGRAYPRAVFDASSAFGAKILSLELLYVAFTRVNNLASIKMLPLREKKKLRKQLSGLRLDFMATRFRCRAERKAAARRLRETAVSQVMGMGVGANGGGSPDAHFTRAGSVTRSRGKTAGAPAGKNVN